MHSLVAASCSKEETVAPLGQTTLTVRASHPGAKVSYSGSGSTVSATWDASDKLAVEFNGQTYELALVGEPGSTTATFSGTIQGTPNEGDNLPCRVVDATAATDFMNQAGTLEGAAKLSSLQGEITYRSGQALSCNLSVTNAAILIFTVPSGTTGPLTYKSGVTEIASAAIPAGATTVYMAVPSGSYTSLQLLQLEGNQACILSTDGANFTAGKTYSKEVTTAHVSGYYDVTDNNNSITVENGDILYGQQMYDQHALTTITIRDGATVTFDWTTLLGCDIIFEGDATLIFIGNNAILNNGSIPISVPVGQEVNIVIEENSDLSISDDWTSTKLLIGGEGAFGTVNITLKEDDVNDGRQVWLYLNGLEPAVGTTDENGNLTNGNGKITVRYGTEPEITIYDNGLTEMEDGPIGSLCFYGIYTGNWQITNLNMY